MALGSQLFLGKVANENELLAEVRSKFAKHQSFEVSFRQAVQQEIFPDQIQQARGILKFKKPHFLSWVYTEPEKKVISYDGESLRINNEEVETAKGVSLEDAFAFLWGEVDSKIFNVSSTAKNKIRLDVKKGVETSFKHIDVELASGRVVKAVVFDHFDGQSELSFSDWRFK